MMQKADAYDALREMLRLTKDEEIDCDRFSELVPAYLDGAIDPPRLRALIEHHRAICAECAEEIALLERALERT